MRNANHFLSPKTGQILIVLAWTLYLVALVLPAGEYVISIINIPFGGAPKPSPVDGWIIAILSVISLGFIPLYLLLIQRQASPLSYASILVYAMLAACLSGQFNRNNNNTILFRNRAMILSGIAFFIFFLQTPDSEFWLDMMENNSSLVLGLLILVSLLCFCLNTYEMRFFTSTSLFFLVVPALAMVVKSREPILEIVSLFLIGLGTLFLLFSNPFSATKKSSKYYCWILCNMALTNLIIPHGMQGYTPAFKAYNCSFLCLVFGILLRTYGNQVRNPAKI